MVNTYRRDIDGLRALAVVSVFLFHLGYITNGYLGVDVFFVISGYLITGLIYHEIEENRFSLLGFYERRVRRIIPLVLLTSIVALVLGLIFMLPDDLENLSQSVFSTNFSANNILMKITSADYWAVKNDYKPLMHTWSLGVEEQFYLFYPALFLFAKGSRKRFILPVITVLTLMSLAAFWGSNDPSSKFYLLQYRFFELSTGGLCAIYFNNNNCLKRTNTGQITLLLFVMLLFLVLYSDLIPIKDIKTLLVTVLTAGILVLGRFQNAKKSLYQALIANPLFLGLGKISFSLYMWHQIVFAFSRYFLVEVITWQFATGLSVLIVILSIISYYAVEKPFRNKAVVKTKPMVLILSSFLVIITSLSLYVYVVGGIVKDVPELGIIKSNHTQLNCFSGHNNINIQYNEDVRKMDSPFSQRRNIKILVLGDSFGRDFVNVLQESSFKDSIEVRYMDLASFSDAEMKRRMSAADYIFFGSNYPTNEFVTTFGLDMKKVWIVGTKDFGNSNGLHYNRKIMNYLTYTTNMKSGYSDLNKLYRKKWGSRYLDLIGIVKKSEERVLVFTPEGKFISQDTRHFTKYGAKYFAKHLNIKLRKIMSLV